MDVERSTSRTRTSGRSPARAPIIKRSSSLSQHQPASASRSSYERSIGDFGSRTYTLAERQPDLTFRRNEGRAEIFADEAHSGSNRLSGTAGSIAGVDRRPRRIEDIANETVDMTTSITTSTHSKPLPPGPSTMPGNGHPAPSVAHNGASASERYATARSRGQRQVGDWILGKTIGAGSMGKVKVVVHQYTKEKVRRFAFPLR